MSIRQTSVFVENIPGALAAVTDTLSKANIDLRALSIADTRDFGVLRMIVDRPDDAAAVLREAGYLVRETSVCAVKLEDKPGALAALLHLISEAGLVVEYLYAFLSKVDGSAVSVIRLRHSEESVAKLLSLGVTCLDEKDLFKT